MSGETVLTVIGNACNDPELRFTPSGAAVAKLRIASTPRKFDKTTNTWSDDEPMFLTCNVWREMAESVAESITKGTRLIVTGRLKCRTWEDKEGQKRQSWELDVDEIGPSLRYATASVKKPARTGDRSSSGRQSSNTPADDPWASSEAPF